MIFVGIFLLHPLSEHFVYFLKESQKNQDKENWAKNWNVMNVMKEGQNGAQGADEMRWDLHIDAWGTENKNREDVADETKQRENRHCHPLRTQFFNVFPIFEEKKTRKVQNFPQEKKFKNAKKYVSGRRDFKLVWLKQKCWVMKRRRRLLRRNVFVLFHSCPE